MSRFFKFILFVLIILLLAVVLMTSLHHHGYWTDGKIALRELKKLDEPATSQRAREAVLHKEHALLKILGRAGVDLSQPDEQGNTALHLAARQRDWTSFNLLREYHMDVNSENGEGINAIAIVMKAGQLKLAENLLENEATPNFKTQNGEPALIDYLRKNEMEKFLLLLRHGADPNVIGANQENALYIALNKGQSKTISHLIEAGSNANGNSPQGDPLLTYFCKNFRAMGYSDTAAAPILDELITAGADPDSKDATGWRPLQWVVQHRFHKGINIILPQTKDVTACLWLALQNEDYATALLLLKKGANPNEPGPSGDSPLHAMIRLDLPDVIHNLLTHGADPEQLGLEGQRPLVTAIAQGNTNAAIALITHERGSDHSAIMEFPVSVEYRELLGKKGFFDWYCKNERGLTPLMAAVIQRQQHVAETLIKHGAKRTQGSHSRVFPIQMAANNQDIKMQQLLIGVPHEDDKQVRKFIIDLSEQRVKFFKNGKLIRVSRVSSGRSGFRTQTGKFVITDKDLEKKSNLYDDASMPYFQRFSCGPIGFHEGETGSRYASHGCIRLPRTIAKYFFYQTKIGDRVEIVK